MQFSTRLFLLSFCHIAFVLRIILQLDDDEDKFRLKICIFPASTEDIDSHRYEWIQQCKMRAWQSFVLCEYFFSFLLVATGIQFTAIPKQRVYKSSLSNFQEISRTHLTKFQQIEAPKYYNMGYKHMHFQLCTFLGFKDVTRFGSVIGMLSYFSWQSNFPGTSVKFQKIAGISRSDVKFQEISTSCRHHAKLSGTDVSHTSNVWRRRVHQLQFADVASRLVNRPVHVYE